jgi:hypothetical protein
MLCFSGSSRAVPVFYSGTGNYYEFIGGSFTWDGAKSAAEALTFNSVQGHLVTILSSGENDFILNNLSLTGQTWMGATDSAVEGDWRWVTSELFWQGGAGGTAQNGLYANWTTGQPDNFSNEDFGIFLLAGTWNDGPSPNPNPVGYIVEYDTNAVPLPAAVWHFGSGLVGLIGIARRKKAA